MSRILDAVCGTPWFITRDKLDQICDIVTRTHIRDLDIEAVEKMRARRLDNTEAARARGGVGIIDVIGPIVRRADFFSDISGATSVSTLARDFNAALADPSINSILLNIDSPGGEANGINEFAEMIYQARGAKPIEAYVGGIGASAAYWIASAADRITIDDGAILGSVGTVMTVWVKEDPNRREYVSSRSPNKRPNPNTESGNAKNQALVDALGDLIIERVARNRGLTADQVVTDFDEGGLLVGQAAVNAKMADRLGSFEGLLAEMSGAKKSNPKSVYAAADLEDEMKLSEVIETVTSSLKAKFASSGQEEKPTQADAPTEKPAESSAAEENAQIDSTVVADLEAKLADEKRARAELLARTQKVDAENFINSMILSAQVYPAEKDSLLALYGQFAADDAANPLAEGTRVEAFETAIKARPKHGLLTESLDPQKTRVLLGDQGKTDELSPERRKELLSKTDLGAAALKVVK